MFHCGAAALPSLLQLVNAIVGGRLPHLPALLHGRLIPIEKFPSKSIRSIAIQGVWARVAALSALAACPAIGSSLKPFHLGIGVRGGSEAMGHALCSALNANAESVVVQTDIKNAFNSVSRAAFMEALSQHHPQLLPLVSWLYGQHSNVWVKGVTPPNLSRKGVRQGDSLGPLLFGIVLQSALKHTDVCHATMK
jgi:hypothetical protein